MIKDANNHPLRVGMWVRSADRRLSQTPYQITEVHPREDPDASDWLTIYMQDKRGDYLADVRAEDFIGTTSERGVPETGAPAAPIVTDPETGYTYPTCCVVCGGPFLPGPGWVCPRCDAKTIWNRAHGYSGDIP